MTTTATTTNTVAAAECTPASRITKSLLGWGMVAGPFYVAVSLTQAVTRTGFDLTKHEWSLLETGSRGWIQSANLILTGLMVIACAVGVGRAVPSKWGARLLAVYGLGAIGAGFFTADPMLGFPAGTPDGPPAAPSLHGTLHIVTAGIGFLAMIAACFVLARHLPAGGWRIATRTVGVLFLAGFAGVASGGGSAALNIAFTVAIVIVWTWLALAARHLYKNA